jgi:hypothetical protein
LIFVLFVFIIYQLFICLSIIHLFINYSFVYLLFIYCYIFLLLKWHRNLISLERATGVQVHHLLLKIMKRKVVIYHGWRNSKHNHFYFYLFLIFCCFLSFLLSFLFSFISLSLFHIGLHSLRITKILTADPRQWMRCPIKKRL